MLSLYNFRCYEKFKIRVTPRQLSSQSGASSITLLSAPSTKGKSTILNGISYALCGEPRKNISTLGIKGAKAKVEYDDGELKISRIQGKNKLVVKDKSGTTLEGEVAQEVINKKYGKNFKTIGYLSQGSSDSFTHIDSKAKLEFLRELVYENVDIDAIEEKIKKYRAEILEKISGYVGRVRAEEEREEKFELPEKVKFPFADEGGELGEGGELDEETEIINERKKFRKELENTFLKLQCKINEIKDDIRMLESDKERLQILNTSLTEINKDITQTKTDLESIGFEGDEKLKEYTRNLEILQKHENVVALKKEYKTQLASLKESEQEEKKNLEQELEGIKLWKNGTRKEVEEKIEKMRERNEIAEKIRKKQRNIKSIQENQLTQEEYENLITMLHKEKEVGEYQCPRCNCILGLRGNCLEVKKKKGKVKDMSEIERKIQTYERNEKEIEEIKEEIKVLYHEAGEEDDEERGAEELEEYVRMNVELEKKKKEYETKLQNKDYGITYSNLLKKCDRLKQQIEENECEMEETTSELSLEELEKLVHIQTNAKTNYYAKKKDLTRLKEKKENTNKNITEIQAKYENINQEIQDRKEQIENLEKDVSKNRVSVKKLEEKLEQAEKYIRYIEKRKELENIRKNIEKYKTLEKKSNREREKLDLFRKKIKEAENIVLRNMINSINIHVQTYIDDFFPEEKMVVELRSTKTLKNKKEKSELNISISYKGVEMDLTSLSGGERQRLDLAYSLAFAEMNNVPILLLDESVSNLDQNNTNIVVSAIKKNYSGKLVIMVAHQVIKGLFDNVIELE